MSLRNPQPDSTPAVLLASAHRPFQLLVDPVTRDSNGNATAASVRWPDGTIGTYTGTASSTWVTSIESYVLTHGSTTYTQPAIVRDGSGHVTSIPAIIVT